MKQMGIMLLLLCFPFVTSAHTKWFASGELPALTTTEPTTIYLIIMSGIVTLVLLVGYFLSKYGIFHLRFLQPKTPQAFERASATFTMVLGSFFLIAGTHEYLFSPNLNIQAGIPHFLISLQIAIGLAFLIGVATRSFAIVLSLVWLTTFYFTGWVTALENLWILSSAIFIAIMGNDYFAMIDYSFFRNKLICFKSYALSILRLGVGLTLVVLGLSEKIMEPAYGINFLQQHSWNFMQNLGLHFSDYLFVLSAGSVEILLGLFFVFGILTRLTALATAIIFTIPLFILGPVELAGHLPHFAAIALLLLFGSGKHFLLTKKYRD